MGAARLRARQSGLVLMPCQKCSCCRIGARARMAPALVCMLLAMFHHLGRGVAQSCKQLIVNQPWLLRYRK